MLPSSALKYPPAGFAPIPAFAAAQLPPGHQFLHAPILYWPLYPSPPVSPTGYYMPGPPAPRLGPLHQGQPNGMPPGAPQLIQTECLGLPPPMASTAASLPIFQQIDAMLSDASPRPISC